MFQRVERVEHTTLTLNLLLLLVVAFIPYPTAVLGRYGALPASAGLRYPKVKVFTYFLLAAFYLAPTRHRSRA